MKLTAYVLLGKAIAYQPVLDEAINSCACKPYWASN